MGASVFNSGNQKRGNFEKNAEMNIIPFIDVLLVLLIIFMSSSPTPTADVKVDLPPPNSVIDTSKLKKPTILEIRDNGQGVAMIYVDGQYVTKEGLINKVLERIAINVPDSKNRLLETIRLRADQTLSYNEVMGVMAKLQEKSFQNIAIVAEDAQIPTNRQ